MNRPRPAHPGALVSLSLLLAATGCDGKLASLPDNELQDRVYECNQTVDQAPGFAISCDNYRRECERRRDQGHYVC